MQGKRRISTTQRRISPGRTIPAHRTLRYGSGFAARIRLIALLLTFGVVACNRNPTVVIHTKSGTSVPITVELAQTPEEHARGLMYRKQLPPDGGMLFIFPDNTVRTFWMKNTILPLDMVFVGDDLRIAGIVENAVPFTLDARSVNAPSRYVIEVIAGYCAKHGIATGDRVELPGNP